MSDKYRKCAKCGISKAVDPSVVLHQFPKPNNPSSVSRVRVWAEFCFPTEDWSSEDSLLKLCSRHKMLCNKHFRNTAFGDAGKTRLNKFAEPEIGLQHVIDMTPHKKIMTKELLQKTKSATARKKQVAALQSKNWCLHKKNADLTSVIEVLKSRSSINQETADILYPIDPRTKNCSMHKFPDPTKNKELFNTWVYSVGGAILQLKNEHIFKYRRVCHLHFEPKYWCRNNRLSNIAVPTLNMPDAVEKNRIHKETTALKNTNDVEDHTKFRVDHEHIGETDVDQEIHDDAVAKHRIYEETAALEHTNDVEDHTEFRVNDGYLGVTDVDQEIHDDAVAKHRIYEGTASLQHTNDVEDLTEFRVNDGYLGVTDVDQEIHDDTEQPKEDGPFSWQKSKEDVIPLDEKRCAEDVTFIGESQLVPDLCDPKEIQIQTEFSCNVCREHIIGFRYACAQCRDWDLCGACEARGEHATHFVLRIPPHKTRSETRAVLAALRQLLAGAALHEDPSVALVKDEVKTEDPLCDDEAPQEPSAVRADVEVDTGQANKDTEPLDAAGSVVSEDDAADSVVSEDDAAGSAASEDELYLETVSEASMSSVEDSITDAPIDKVYATRQKRKLSCADRSDTVPQKVQKQDGRSFQLHYDNSTNELILSGNTKVQEPAHNEYFSATRRKRNDSAPQIKIKDLKLYVVRNAVIAPHRETGSFTATNSLIRKSKDNHLIASHTEKDCIVSSSSLSVEQPLELSSLASGVDTNDDGHPVEVIDCPKELRVTVTRLADDEVRAATGPRGGKR